MSPTRYLNDRSQRRVDRCRPVICELCGPLSHQATSINRGWVRFGQNSTTRAFVLRGRSIRRFTPFTCSYGGITRGSPCLGDSRFSILSSCEFPVKQPPGIEIESTKDPGMPVRGGRTAASALLTSAGRRSQAPRRRVVVGYRDAAVKISHLVVNSVHAVLMPEPLADTPAQTWQNARRRAAPPTDGHNAIRQHNSTNGGRLCGWAG
jgi:hypothetical protein